MTPTELLDKAEEILGDDLSNWSLLERTQAAQMWATLAEHRRHADQPQPGEMLARLFDRPAEPELKWDDSTQFTNAEEEMETGWRWFGWLRR